MLFQVVLITLLYIAGLPIAAGANSEEMTGFIIGRVVSGALLFVAVAFIRNLFVKSEPANPS